jgi:oxygen-independent coproporphyrinogen-3 oxidase
MIVRHLYVHVPFCHRICPYCAFYKHQPGETSTSAVADALLAELDRHRDRFEIVPETIYFGGGTPTLLSKTVLATLLEGFHHRLPMDSLKEWTLEANPKTFDAEKATLMRDHGVSRVSLGVQSWNPTHLETLGRDHSPDEAEASYQLLCKAGIPLVNVDLMFSLPNQSLADWRADLERTLTLQPSHLSAYNLTYEEDTPFFKQLGKGAFRDDEDNNADHFYLADELLSAAGYGHYEISNYAKPGAESQHNRAYWAGNDYLGLGPSAVSTVGGKRWRNVPDTALYARSISNIQIDEEILSDDDHHNERVALLLRTLEGIPVTRLSETSRQRATELAEEGVLEVINDHFRLTHDHRALVDPVAADLFV